MKIKSTELREIIPQITDPRLLEYMAEEGKLLAFEKDNSIMEPGQFIKMVPIVLSGAIKILRMDEDGKELFLYHLEPGETCALSLTCCSAQKPSEIRAVAEERTTILAIPLQRHEHGAKL